MKNVLVVCFALFAHSAFADGVWNLRYGNIDNSSIVGGSVSTLNGAGEYGVTVSVDFAKSDKVTNKNADFGEIRGYKLEHTNIMGGLTYGVTDNLYIMPKVGISSSKKRDYIPQEICVDSGCGTIMTNETETKYRPSYGLDFMFSKGHFTAGVGFTDFYYLDERETRANISIGFKLP